MSENEQLLDKLAEAMQKKILEYDTALKKINDRIKELESRPAVPTEPGKNSETFTNLPAYKYAAAFKEIKRPADMNDLYMVVLQMQHHMYELQTHIDNISRRN